MMTDTSARPCKAAEQGPARRKAIDWKSIERDYRAGQLSLRALASKHGCSHSAIANFAGRHGWSRNAYSTMPTHRLIGLAAERV